MDHPVESLNDITMQILDHVGGKLSIGLFILRYVVNLILLKVLIQNDWFLKVTIRLYLPSKFKNLFLLCLHPLVNVCLHPLKERVYLVNIFQNHWLRPLGKIILLFELFPKLCTPLCQDSQNGWTFDDKILALDLLFGILRCVFTNFSANFVLCVFLDLLLVL